MSSLSVAPHMHSTHSLQLVVVSLSTSNVNQIFLAKELAGTLLWEAGSMSRRLTDTLCFSHM